MADVGTVLDAVGEANRRRLLELLHEHHDATVSDLVASSGMRQPQVSKHLRVLADAELVSVRADGRFRRYRLHADGLRAAHDWFASFEDVWRARFDALDALVSTPPPAARRMPDAALRPESDHRSEPEPRPEPETRP